MDKREALLSVIRTCDGYFTSVAKAYAELKVLAEQTSTSLAFLQLTSTMGKHLMIVMQDVGYDFREAQKESEVKDG